MSWQEEMDELARRKALAAQMGGAEKAPFGFALFYLRGVAPPEVTTMHIYRGVIPFIVLQLTMLLILALFPALATWLPQVVFG
ncbi:MAG: TRAP transporter large permease subunit, partial [Burkholderiales bacterium]